MANLTDQLLIVLTANSSQAVNVFKGFSSTAQSELGKVEAGAGASGSRAGALFGDNLQKSSVLAIAGIQAAVATLGGVKLLSFAKDSVSDAVQLERTSAALDAQLKAVGETAGVSGEQIDRMANRIQATDAIFQGTAKQGASLLLTFDQVQNKVGAGNEVFNRALAAASAMSVVLGKDLNTSVIQLGRALENPLANLQAFSRAGVAISEQTKEQVKQLARQGDLVGAQKVLLTALEDRYGAAAAAIAKADPIKQFGVSLQAFKTQVGEDLLPLAEKVIGGVEAIMGAFTDLPGPVRTGIETLAGIAIVAVPIAKVITLLNTLKTAAAGASITNAASVGGSGAAAATGVGATATATSTQGNAATKATEENLLYAESLDNIDRAAKVATVSEGELAGAIEVEGGAAGLATGENAAAAATQELNGGLAATAGTASLLGTALGFVGPVLLGVGAGLLVAGKLGEHASHTFQQLTTDVAGFAQRRFSLDTSTIVAGIGQNPLQYGARKGAQADIKTLREGFEQILDTQGVDAAQRALSRFNAEFAKAGGDPHALGAAKEGFADLYTEIGNVAQAEAAAKTNTDDLAVSLHANLVGGLQEVKAELGIADDLDSIGDALHKLADDRADLAGTSDKAIQADREERDAKRGVIDATHGVSDAYARLRDQQDSVVTSSHSLLEAQHELDLYNSPRGAHERQLQLDIIQRRVVSTPAESDQKQFDLLQFQDQGNQKKVELQDKVINAQKAYRDALRGVSSAEDDIKKATDKVRDANDAVTIAVHKRQKLSEDAATAVAGDERKVKEEVLKTLDAIDAAGQASLIGNDQITGLIRKTLGYAQLFDPKSEMYRNTKAYLDMVDAAAKGSQQNIAQQQHDAIGGFLNPTGPKANGLSGSRGEYYTDLTSGKTTDDYETWAHKHHVPGFADGGTVPGIPGEPRLILAHGGERVLTAEQQRQQGGVHVEQNNHFSGNATLADLDYANRELGWRLSRGGRG